VNDTNIIRVHLVDDHVLVRDGIRALLERQPNMTVVAQSSCGEDAYGDYFKHCPDVLLLDVVMPGEGGLSVLRRIIGRDAQAHVLMLSMYDDAVVAKNAIEVGALGYISKGTAVDELYKAVLKVAAGEAYIGADIAQRMALLKSGRGPSLDLLSGREFEVFQLLAAGKSVLDIADLLHLSPKTVGTHRTRIMEKLSCGNVAELAGIAIRQGVITA